MGLWYATGQITEQLGNLKWEICELCATTGSAGFHAPFWNFGLSTFGANGVFGHARSTRGSEKAFGKSSAVGALIPNLL